MERTQLSKIYLLRGVRKCIRSWIEPSLTPAILKERELRSRNIVTKLTVTLFLNSILDRDLNLQISSLGLYHMCYPGSIDGTGLNLPLKNNAMQALWSVTLSVIIWPLANLFSSCFRLLTVIKTYMKRTKVPAMGLKEVWNTIKWKS